jgi:hypothetical protein
MADLLQTGSDWLAGSVGRSVQVYRPCSSGNQVLIHFARQHPEGLAPSQQFPDESFRPWLTGLGSATRICSATAATRWLRVSDNSAVIPPVILSGSATELAAGRRPSASSSWLVGGGLSSETHSASYGLVLNGGNLIEILAALENT